MDQFSEKQEKILRDKVQLSALYPELWKKMIAEWNTPDPQNRVWLTYAANYIFRTNNIHWAIDPLTLSWRLKDSPRVDVARDLHDLSFVLLTHEHADHLDLELISALRDQPITWVVPGFLLEKVVTEADLPRERVIVPSPKNMIELHGLHILPFDGEHWETLTDGTIKGVPAMGYMIECNGRRWLFPGDTRTYDLTQTRRFEAIDTVFAHIWLGRGCALEDGPPLLEAFCRFHFETGARQIVLTHLNELGRDANDYWDDVHVSLIRTKFQEMTPDMPIFSLTIGDSAPL